MHNTDVTFARDRHKYPEMKNLTLKWWPAQVFQYISAHSHRQRVKQILPRYPLHQSHWQFSVQLHSLNWKWPSVSIERIFQCQSPAARLKLKSGWHKMQQPPKYFPYYFIKNQQSSLALTLFFLAMQESGAFLSSNLEEVLCKSP